jgi:hypothetical protein
LKIPEELTLDYAEITSIPPLPLWTLLEADKETQGMVTQQNEEEKVKKLETLIYPMKSIILTFKFKIGSYSVRVSVILCDINEGA